MTSRWALLSVSGTLACSAPEAHDAPRGSASTSSSTATSSSEAALSVSPTGTGTAPVGVPSPNSSGFASIGFVTQVLETAFYAEGATVADLDGDGAPDLIAGPVWYAGPTFTTRHTYADAPTFALDSYSLFFLTFTDDVNGDGKPDIVGIAGPNGATSSGDTNARWYENPGNLEGRSSVETDVVWTSHLLFDGTVSNESPIFADIDGDDQPELVFMTNQQLGYASRGSDGTAPWAFTAISDARFATPYVHGLGVGDVSGDGKPDIVEKSGWWEQPATGNTWLRHEVDFALGGQGGAQMLVMDVDDDGDADVVTSLNAHGYGLAWFEQRAPDSFLPHELLPGVPTEMNVSQLHALATGDINGDGLSDFALGKRYYAHPSTSPDPGTTDPALLYWFEHTNDPEQRFVPHLVHADSGAGCSFVAEDVNADGKVDIFATNKHGTFLHLQQ
jgi:hypothetical protein